MGDDVLKVCVANFDGRCGLGCEKPIRDGDDIVRVDGEWCHTECADDDGHEVTYGA